MQFFTIAAALLLPVLAFAEGDPTTTLTSTTHLTRTLTVSKVVASVTSTYPAGNSTTVAGPTAVGTTSYTTPIGTGVSSSSTGTGTSKPPAETSTISGASSLNSFYAGSAGLVVMVAAAFL